ncbi:MAG: hypothetical protein KatS3mg042_1098 [Rhodothermaceae bacterium]|nr:MAG: hypothetical protein KatS3mg042_1098 [Rhodothermaceae bacterium]
MHSEYFLQNSLVQLCLFAHTTYLLHIDTDTYAMDRVVPHCTLEHLLHSE